MKAKVFVELRRTFIVESRLHCGPQHCGRMQMQRADARAKGPLPPRAVVRQFLATLCVLLALLFIVPLLGAKRKVVYQVLQHKRWKTKETVTVVRS